MCLELREQHTRAGSPWAELCVGHCCPLSLLPKRKAGTALSQQHPGHTTICPCGFYLVQNRLNSHPIFFREAQSHLPSADAGKQDEEQVPELLHLLSDLFYHTLQKRIQFWTQKASLYQVERAQLQVPLPAGYSRELHGATKGHVIPVCVYTGCAPLLLRHCHQHQEVNCWLSNGLGTHPLIEAAAVQLAPYRTNACKRCYSFSPGTLPLLGPYCELQSRDCEPCSRAAGSHDNHPAAGSSTLPVHGF